MKVVFLLLNPPPEEDIENATLFYNSFEYPKSFGVQYAPQAGLGVEINENNAIDSGRHRINYVR
jgi:hypothetical protein